MDFAVHDTPILTLRMLLDFQKAKKHSFRLVVFLRFSKVLQHPACNYKRIMHGNQYGIPLAADHLTFEEGVGDIRERYPASSSSKKKLHVAKVM